MMRLHKFMAASGVASRRKCEELIESSLVTVNGEIAVIGMSIDPEKDVVMYNGSRLRLAEKLVVIMFNKPRGVLCTCSDPEGRRTTSEFFTDLGLRLYNVGRLDYDSEGLLLLTNDGDFANHMMHPSHEVNKTYRALVDGTLTQAECDRLSSGVMLSDGMTRPAKIENVSPIGENTSLYITIHEGRNRQVRRMIEAVGHRTLRLRRVAIGSLKLFGLHSGEWRYLSENEIAALRGK